ncbi:hypothetical protein FH972_018439 [Carpinus fangiana]|uniref:NAC domain-containing protein n=1 Tax=Carpinus fangiana TaxID=176857 RepID=A0A5N6RLY9_9ROSI|nr:hypothetical protein FH972_018439 [Carpinus fangiana]
MYPPAASTPEPNPTDEEVISSLNKVIHGAPLPGNVLDINPFIYMPKNLPGGFWFLIHSNVNKDNKDGFWKTKGEPCKIFSHSGISGWRSTFEFYEGKAPHQCKTDWVMQEYRISREGNNAKEASSLCRVFRDHERSKTHEMLQKLASTDTARENNIRPSQLNVPDADIGQSSTSRPQVSEDDGTGVLAMTEIVPDPWLENLHEIGSGGDFLELLDLDDPLSPYLDNPALSSSSSENSSCLSISSGECFDSLALLQDLEPENSQKDAGCKFSVSASHRPNEVVVLPATSATISDRTDVLPHEEIPKTMSSKDDALKLASRNQNPNFRDEGPSSNNHNVTPAAPAGKIMAAGGRRKYLMKFLCFMSF